VQNWHEKKGVKCTIKKYAKIVYSVCKKNIQLNFCADDQSLFQMFTNALVNVNTNLEVNVKHTYSGFFGFASYTLFKIYIIKYT